MQVSVNQERTILESDYDDNISYALIRIAGSKVVVLERGYGSGPDDPERLVLDPWW